MYRQQNLATRGWLLANDNVKANVQKYFDCCGFINNSNIFEPSATNPLGHPTCSKLHCCTKNPIDSLCCTDDPKATVDKCPCNACWNKLHTKIDSALKASGGIGMFFSFTELIGIYLSMKFRNMKDPYVEFNAFPQ
ncbi:unnamed protein product [Gordionus sp. m RMFG-2023]